MRAYYPALVFICFVSSVRGQSGVVAVELHLYKPKDADSIYILRFTRKNDFRVSYISQRTSLGYGTKVEGTKVNMAMYNNVSDMLGFGLTYKFIDFDLAFSLPQSHFQDTGLQNLTQFRLSGTYTSRKYLIRGYYFKSDGMVAVDEADQFKSSPDVSMVNAGIQFTYCFNFSRYSLRAATLQNELQHRSAGTFMIRTEPFYRKLGVGTVLVPTALDVPSLYGEQVGLRYAYAPGLMVLPGYGYTWAMGEKFFVSPMIFLGTGLAVNVYKGDAGERTSINSEWEGSMTLNMGYNGPRTYAAIRSSFEMHYFMLDPSYFTTSNLKINLTIGYRFVSWEKSLPEKLF